jgi:hypothetical protein
MQFSRSTVRFAPSQWLLLGPSPGGLGSKAVVCERLSSARSGPSNRRLDLLHSGRSLHTDGSDSAKTASYGYTQSNARRPVPSHSCRECLGLPWRHRDAASRTH